MITKSRGHQQARPFQAGNTSRFFQKKAFVIITLAALLFSYAGFANNVATLGYKLDAAEQEVAVLQKTQTNLELDIAAARSLPRVEAVVGSLALVPASTIEYAASTATAVAIR
ncbi:MAG: hypothetical protein WC817_02530 [Patescibacteria group bacterium]|jgi:hypothetical protein